MLIRLTQRRPAGAPGTPVLVNPDLILHATGVEGNNGGASLMMSNGVKLDVHEDPDCILDLCDDAQDEGARKKARGERKKTREEREHGERKRAADDEAAKARKAHEEALAETAKHKQALAGAEARARQAAQAAGQNPPGVDRPDVTPEGIDLKHPAPQPHQKQPVGTARPDDPTAAPQPGSEDFKKAQEAEKAAAKESQEKQAQPKSPPPQAHHGRK